MAKARQLITGAPTLPPSESQHVEAAPDASNSQGVGLPLSDGEGEDQGRRKREAEAQGGNGAAHARAELMRGHTNSRSSAAREHNGGGSGGQRATEGPAPAADAAELQAVEQAGRRAQTGPAEAVEGPALGLRPPLGRQTPPRNPGAQQARPAASERRCLVSNGRNDVAARAPAGNAARPLVDDDGDEGAFVTCGEASEATWADVPRRAASHVASSQRAEQLHAQWRSTLCPAPQQSDQGEGLMPGTARAAPVASDTGKECTAARGAAAAVAAGGAVAVREEQEEGNDAGMVRDNRRSKAREHAERNEGDGHRYPQTTVYGSSRSPGDQEMQPPTYRPPRNPPQLPGSSEPPPSASRPLPLGILDGTHDPAALLQLLAVRLHPLHPAAAGAAAGTAQREQTLRDAGAAAEADSGEVAAEVTHRAACMRCSTTDTQQWHPAGAKGQVVCGDCFTWAMADAPLQPELSAGMASIPATAYRAPWCEAAALSPPVVELPPTAAATAASPAESLVEDERVLAGEAAAATAAMRPPNGSALPVAQPGHISSQPPLLPSSYLLPPSAAAAGYPSSRLTRDEPTAPFPRPEGLPVYPAAANQPSQVDHACHLQAQAPPSSAAASTAAASGGSSTCNNDQQLADMFREMSDEQLERFVRVRQRSLTADATANGLANRRPEPLQSLQPPMALAATAPHPPAPTAPAAPPQLTSQQMQQLMRQLLQAQPPLQPPSHQLTLLLAALQQRSVFATGGAAAATAAPAIGIQVAPPGVVWLPGAPVFRPALSMSASGESTVMAMPRIAAAPVFDAFAAAYGGVAGRGTALAVAQHGGAANSVAATSANASGVPLSASHAVLPAPAAGATRMQLQHGYHRFPGQPSKTDAHATTTGRALQPPVGTAGNAIAALRPLQPRAQQHGADASTGPVLQPPAGGAANATTALQPRAQQHGAGAAGVVTNTLINGLDGGSIFRHIQRIVDGLQHPRGSRQLSTVSSEDDDVVLVGPSPSVSADGAAAADSPGDSDGGGGGHPNADDVDEMQVPRAVRSDPHPRQPPVLRRVARRQYTEPAEPLDDSEDDDYEDDAEQRYADAAWRSHPLDNDRASVAVHDSKHGGRGRGRGRGATAKRRREGSPGSLPTKRRSIPTPGGPCSLCHTNMSVQWRRGPATHPSLCNACGVAWKKQGDSALLRRGAHPTGGHQSAAKVHNHSKKHKAAKAARYGYPALPASAPTSAPMSDTSAGAGGRRRKRPPRAYSPSLYPPSRRRRRVDADGSHTAGEDYWNAYNHTNQANDLPDGDAQERIGTGETDLEEEEDALLQLHNATAVVSAAGGVHGRLGYHAVAGSSRGGSQHRHWRAATVDDAPGAEDVDGDDDAEAAAGVAPPPGAPALSLLAWMMGSDHPLAGMVEPEQIAGNYIETADTSVLQQLLSESVDALAAGEDDPLGAIARVDCIQDALAHARREVKRRQRAGASTR